MARKTATTERTARVGRRRQVVTPREMLETRKGNGVLITARSMVDADDTKLTPEEAKMVRQA